MVDDTLNLIEHVWNIIKLYIFFVPCTFFIKLTVFEIIRFLEFLRGFFWNCNKTIMVEDTLNLMPHFRKEINMRIFFIRDTFLIRFTVYEILRVIRKMAAENMQDSIIREPRGVKVGGHAVKGWWYFLLYLGTLLNDFWVDNLLKSPHGPFYA